MRIYTKKGDDGTTGLLYGGRVAKDAGAIELNGAVDEAQACLGVARAQTERGGELDTVLIDVERDLYTLMAEVATAESNREKLRPGVTLVTEDMVEKLELMIDAVATRFEMPTEFVIPGESRCAAALDVARTVVRRAERQAVANRTEGSLVQKYLNRLSDLIWALARLEEGDGRSLARSSPARTVEAEAEGRIDGS